MRVTYCLRAKQKVISNLRSMKFDAALILEVSMNVYLRSVTECANLF